MLQHAESRYPSQSQNMPNIFPLNLHVPPSTPVTTTTTNSRYMRHITTSNIQLNRISIFRRTSTSSSFNVPADGLRWLPPEREHPSTSSNNDPKNRNGMPQGLRGLVRQHPLPSDRQDAKPFFDRKRN